MRRNCLRCCAWEININDTAYAWQVYTAVIYRWPLLLLLLLLLLWLLMLLLCTTQALRAVTLSNGSRYCTVGYSLRRFRICRCLLLQLLPLLL
jgi:hypothetical protein